MKTPQLLYYDLSPRVTAFSSTRHGGYGTGTYAEWNINRYSGDDAAHIEANRAALLELLGISSEALIMPHQNHGTNGVVIDDAFLSLPPEAKAAALEGRDYIATDKPGICIGVSTADCVPILLHDPVRHVVAAVHSGWRGTVQRIVTKVIAQMDIRYGTRPQDLRAVIGPAIGPDSFQVGEEVVRAFSDTGFPMDEIGSLRDPQPGKPMSGGHHIDLWQANRWLLGQAGIPANAIQVIGIDTYQSPDFFSARRETIACGRIINAIKLL